MLWPYLQIIENSLPTATLSGVLFAERDWHSVENLFVPFGTDGVIEMIAVCVEVDRNGVKSDVSHGLILDWAG